MASKAPPFVAAKKGPKGAAAVGKTPAGNPFAAKKAPPFGAKAPAGGKKPNPFAK
jgi:hypothetical protein